MHVPRSQVRVLVTIATAVAFAAAFMMSSAAQAPPAQGGAAGQPPAGRGGGAPPATGQRGGGRAVSPAAQRPPETATPQTYPEDQVTAGRALFAAQCGFCHGRDAMGGETGPDLTRSDLVAADVRGDKIAPVIKNGRPEKKMPPFNFSDTDLASLVAFIHDAKAKAGTLEGSRRTVEPADLQTGNAQAGQQYFNGPGGCAKCHSPADFSGLATRYPGLALFQRMLNPTGRGRGGATPRLPEVTVTLPGGRTVTGRLAYQDEFTIALTDSSDRYHSWPTTAVKFRVDDPYEAHFTQLGRYTNDDVHNVLAYLQTLR
jgi:cytochrome c oxidase cbb3-type subunit 3